MYVFMAWYFVKHQDNFTFTLLEGRIMEFVIPHYIYVE
jgi:hypothetical protein